MLKKKKKKKEQNIFSQNLPLEENLTEGKECQLDSIASTLLLLLPNNQTKRTILKGNFEDMKW